MTAFTVGASLEYAGRKRGARGLFGWIARLPYFDKENYLFGYFICGLILFIFGGLSGIVNASYSLNATVHNTSWLPGHFHMTVAGPVLLAILGLSLYIYSSVSGREVKHRSLATIVPLPVDDRSCVFLAWPDGRRANGGTPEDEHGVVLYQPRQRPLQQTLGADIDDNAVWGIDHGYRGFIIFHLLFRDGDREEDQGTHAGAAAVGDITRGKADRFAAEHAAVGSCLRRADPDHLYTRIDRGIQIQRNR